MHKRLNQINYLIELLPYAPKAARVDWPFLVCAECFLSGEGKRDPHIKDN